MINIQLSSQLSQREPWWQFMLFPKALSISLAGLIISLIAYFPGAMSPDSFNMWGMGWKWNWNDWHSPYIALLMAVSRLLRDDPAIYLFFQLLLLWGGIYLCAAAMRKSVGDWALLVPVLGFTPMFIVVSGFLHKSPLQAAIFLFSFGVIYLHHAWDKRLSVFSIMFLLILFFVGIPLRRFGYLSVIPLLVYFLYVLFRRGGTASLMKYLVGALAISVSSLLVYNFILFDILDVTQRHKIQILYQYDLAAIYALTGVDFAPRFIKKEFSQLDAVRKEYAKHSGLWRIINIYKRTTKPKEIAYYKDAWQTALRDQPYMWLQHKVHAFAKSLGYNTSMRGFRHAGSYNGPKNIFGLQKSKNSLYFLLEKYITSVQNGLCMKPWLWLIITYVMLFLGLLLWSRLHSLQGAILPHIILLTSAGLFYPAYFLISFSPDLRFTYWAITATTVATLGILLTLLTYWRRQVQKRNKERIKDRANMLSRFGCIFFYYHLTNLSRLKYFPINRPKYEMDIK